jgi:hypothetical protein
MSLVELLAALTLSVILLGAILGVSSRLSRSQELLRQKYPLVILKSRLELQLNNDFQNCRTIMVDADKSEIAMLTCRSTNPDGVTRNQLPSAVLYQIVSSNQKSYLLRIERPLIENVEGRVLKSVICQDVARLVVAQNLETDYPPPSLSLNLVRSDGEVFTLCLTRHGGRE